MFIDEASEKRQLTTATTGPMNRALQIAGPRKEKQEHSQYLIELIRPFASRAGTQGIAYSNKRSISQRPREFQRTGHMTQRLSPIAREN